MVKFLIVKAMILAGLLGALTGCANKRFYCGFDDYGDTQHRNEQWQTGNRQGGGR